MSEARMRPVASPGLVLLALAVGGLAIGTTEFAAMSLLPYFADGLGIDEPTAGHVISAYALGVVVGAPVIAVLGARLERRSLLIGLMAVFALGNGLSALAPSYAWMMGFRFLSGLPHGAYFGVAALVAVSVVPPERRARAVARMMTGLTVATIVGVPLANAIGLGLGWRWGFALVSLLAVLTMVLVWRFAPAGGHGSGGSPLAELSALKRGQVWMTLGIGAIGFGGLFCVYSYLASTLMAVTGLPDVAVPVVLAVFGCGMTIGTLGAAWAADRALMPAAAGILLWSAISLGLFVFAAPNVVAVTITVFLIGCTGGLGTVLQTRLMDVAGDAQTLAAALNHSAFNVANALGPYLGGLAIAAGFGWTATGWVGSLLALAGLGLLGVSVVMERRTAAVPGGSCPSGKASR